MSSTTRRAALALCLALLFVSAERTMSGAAEGEGRSAAESLPGVWGSEQTAGPAVRGELTLDARGAAWRASIAGYEVPVTRAGDEVRFKLPGDAGEFRGRRGRDPRQIAGHWIQPVGVGANTSPRATPVELSAIAPSVWRGTVTPLDETIAYYVSINRGTDGTLSAFVRDPVTNHFRGRTFAVEAKEKDALVRFSLNGETAFEGTYDAESDTLALPLLDGRPPLRFTRRTRHDAVGFYPRVAPHEGPYVYRAPVADSDGWPTASLSEVGLDPRPVAALVEKILNARPALDNPVNIHSLLIARHGKLVFEEYFYGFDKERPHDMRSASKTFTTLLVGLARDRGAKIEPQSPVYPYFPDLKPYARWDERKSRMTVRDLLTMTSGYNCRGEWGEDPMYEQTAQPDWFKFTLDMPTARDPGGREASYCSADINLLGGIVRNTTGTWLPEFFHEHVARPLRMRRYHFNLMPNGEAFTGGGVYMRPRDQLKLGQLYLAGGVWQGRRLVSREWVRDSVARHSDFKPGIDIDIDHGYGYGWHVRDHRAGGRVFHDYYAAGNGGQLIIVIPALDMVVGFTGGDYAEARKFYRWEIELLPQHIIPSALPAEARPSGRASGGK